MVYFPIDCIVAFGVPLRWVVSDVCFFLAALSQVVLYSAGFSWIMDVPESVRPSPMEMEHLQMMIPFHVVTMCIMVAILLFEKRQHLPRESDTGKALLEGDRNALV